MITYDIFCRIKQAQAGGRTPPQIAGELDLHLQTVRKWLPRERFERSLGAGRPRRSKLDEHRGAIVRWLDSHPFTVMQLWHKLREQGYTGGYSILKDYVRRIRPNRIQAFSLPRAVRPGRLGQLRLGAGGRRHPAPAQLLCPGARPQPVDACRIYP